ncbi:MAG: hypothetical protein GFH23_1086674n96 [Chloroflexi bacterium AL-N1]|nr:hypothetical protein [Chloroflexi bacterium AL-N1]NOK92183.1 hypothetical protein [Chloroflexi bacterium AL-N15]
MEDASLAIRLLLELNGLLVVIVVIVTFSLLAYIALQNWHTPIARALCVLLTGVMVVFGGEVFLISSPERESIVQFLLRAQWVGIVCIPAGYIHLTDTLLTHNGLPSRARRWLVILGYILSLAFLGVALSTNWLVRDGIAEGILPKFGAGPLFWVFAIYFVLSSLGGLFAVVNIRRSALTSTLRRRLTYLGATFLAPGLAVFPFLIIAGTLNYLSQVLVLLFSAIGNAGVAVMLIVMVYSIAFQGLLLPDRLIKQDFIRWGLYGPFVGISIVLFLRIVSILARYSGLPAEVLTTFGVMIMSVVFPIFVSKVKPYLDALVYRQDRAEIDYLRGLPRNTFTYTDLRSLLENTLLVVCGALRVDTGFVAAPDLGHGYTIKALVGSRRVVKQFVGEHALLDIVTKLEGNTTYRTKDVPPEQAFSRYDGFSLLPLRGPEGDIIGALGVSNPEGGLTSGTRRLIGVLAHQMELALTTVQMQQSLFDTLRGMGPEMRSLQELNSRLEQATPASLESMEAEVALLPEFPQLVKEALGQYWGGPKLSDSPLLELRTVRRSLGDNGGSPTRALQSVLRQAIENLRPDSQLDPSAQEWLLYNILEMRFLQGKLVRDTAQRLSMSESDFYRKQRAAIEEVARQLALMEESERR